MRELLPILVACEYSDTVAGAFRARGFETYSCDLRPTEGARAALEGEAHEHG